MSTLFKSQITAAGFQRAPMTDIIAAIEASKQAAYGSDIDLDPRSPDGQEVGGFAEMFDDLNGNVYDLWQGLANPNGATGVLLDGMMILTGCPREGASYSVAPQTFVGDPGTVIPTTFAVLSTLDGTTWHPSEELTIGGGGTVVGTVQCATIGPPASGTVPADTITQIQTPITGLTSTTNAVGTPGYLAEGDPNGRVRRQASVAVASQAMTDGLTAALLLLDGVKQAVVWENNTNAVLPIGAGGTVNPNSIYVLCVVQTGTGDGFYPASTGSGDDPIANTIFALKGGGCGTQGSVSKAPEDSKGHAHPIAYDFATQVATKIRIAVTKRYNYPTDGASQIAAAIVAWANGSNPDTNKPNIAIGGDSLGNLSWTDVLASFVNSVHGFDFTSMQFSVDGGSTWSANGANVPLAFNQLVTISSSDIAVTES